MHANDDHFNFKIYTKLAQTTVICLSFAYSSTKGIIASSFLRLCSSLKKPVRVPGSVPCANYGIICFYILKIILNFF
jgi:hypothetical protein